MAKKTGRTAPTRADARSGRPVRLELTTGDHARLERCAAERGLSKASYARMAVLERIKADEGSK
jgi:hypothetical protein